MFGAFDSFTVEPLGLSNQGFEAPCVVPPSFHDVDVIKIFVRRNGTSDALREVFLPPNSKLTDLLEKCTKAAVNMWLRRIYVIVR